MSSRYALAVCVCLGLALVPTIIHSYAGVRVADDRRAGDVPAVLAGYTSEPSRRNATWGQRRFESDDWIERSYRQGGDEVTLTVVRSYDAKALYHHPELAIAYGTTYLRSEMVRVPGHDAVPVHVLRADEGGDAAAAYVLHYGDGFVENPIRFQIGLSGRLLFTGRRPMTVLFAQDANLGAGALEQTGLLKVLLAAVDAFAGQPPAGTRTTS